MKDKLIKFKVRCIRERPRINDMQIKLIYEDETGYIPYPTCQGCDELNGSEECDICTGKITLMFKNNPDLDVSRPLIITYS